MCAGTDTVADAGSGSLGTGSDHCTTICAFTGANERELDLATGGVTLRGSGGTVRARRCSGTGDIGGVGDDTTNGISCSDRADVIRSGVSTRAFFSPSSAAPYCSARWRRDAGRCSAGISADPCCGAGGGAQL